MADTNVPVPRTPDPASLVEAISRRQRGQEVVMVLHPEVPLDDAAFESANVGVTVRRNSLVSAPHQVYIFDRQELLKAGMARVTGRGRLEVDRLPGAGSPG